MLDAGGVVLRYGYFYGPGSAISRTGSMAADVSRRRLPIVGAGAGVWSFIHVADAASATVAALALQGPNVLNVVDDEPARVSEWLPALSEALGAPAPRRVPAPVAKLAAGSYGTAVMTSAQGAANAAARAQLPGWSRATRPGARASARGCRGPGARRYLRTTSATPATSSSRPITRSALTSCLATPSSPKRSIATDTASWPVITTAVSPAAPSVRTTTSATDT